MPVESGPLPILLVVLDGMADRPYAELDGRTPLEAASTPTMDALAREGQSGFCYPLGPGRVPSTELVHFRFFGYEGHHFPDRACLEAVGENIPCEPGDVFAFLALRRVSRGPEGDYRVASGYGETFDGAQRGYDALDGWEDGPSGYRFEVFPLAPYERGEAILRVRRGSATEPPCGEITDSDPFFFTALPVLKPRPSRSASRPRAATLTAEALGRFLSAAADEMAGKKHSTAKDRFRRLVVSKWAGTYEPPIPFEERTGFPGAIVASGRMMRGLAHTLGLRFVAADAPGGSATGLLEDPAGDLRGKLEEALGLLSSGEVGFVHVHSKAADEAAHAGEVRGKVEAIEGLDRALSPLRSIPSEDLVLCVTSDHCTPVGGRTVHWGDSVPVLVRGPHVRVDDVESLGERASTRGTLGQIGAGDLLPYLLCQAEAAHFLGARPKPSQPLGVPVSGEPWFYEEPDGSAAGRSERPSQRESGRRPEGHAR